MFATFVIVVGKILYETFELTIAQKDIDNIKTVIINESIFFINNIN